VSLSPAFGISSFRISDPSPFFKCVGYTFKIRCRKESSPTRINNYFKSFALNVCVLLNFALAISPPIWNLQLSANFTSYPPQLKISLGFHLWQKAPAGPGLDPSLAYVPLTHPFRTLRQLVWGLDSSPKPILLSDHASPTPQQFPSKRIPSIFRPFFTRFHLSTLFMPSFFKTHFSPLDSFPRLFYQAMLIPMAFWKRSWFFFDPFTTFGCRLAPSSRRCTVSFPPRLFYERMEVDFPIPNTSYHLVMTDADKRACPSFDGPLPSHEIFTFFKTLQNMTSTPPNFTKRDSLVFRSLQRTDFFSPVYELLGCEIFHIPKC